MKSVRFLADLQKKKGLSDTALAEVLGISQPAVSNYKAGRRIMDDETCLAIALQLGIDPMQVLGAAFLDRAEKTGQKSLWEVFMTRAAMTAGAVLVASGVNLFLTPDTANAATMRFTDDNVAENANYAKLCRHRKYVSRHVKHGLALLCKTDDMFYLNAVTRKKPGFFAVSSS